MHSDLVTHLKGQRIDDLRLAKEPVLVTKLVVLNDPLLSGMRQLFVPHVLFQLGHGALVPQMGAVGTFEELHYPGDDEPGCHDAEQLENDDHVNVRYVLLVRVPQASPHERDHGA